jgi:hypothetical protein
MLFSAESVEKRFLIPVGCGESRVQADEPHRSSLVGKIPRGLKQRNHANDAVHFGHRILRTTNQDYVTHSPSVISARTMLAERSQCIPRDRLRRVTAKWLDSKRTSAYHNALSLTCVSPVGPLVKGHRRYARIKSVDIGVRAEDFIP